VLVVEGELLVAIGLYSVAGAPARTWSGHCAPFGEGLML
jgi:hypothetical protein